MRTSVENLADGATPKPNENGKRKRSREKWTSKEPQPLFQKPNTGKKKRTASASPLRKRSRYK